jgi:excisionase family DNA binding protein
MPTRYLSAIPRDEWPREALEVEALLSNPIHSRSIVTPAWFGIPPQPTLTSKQLAHHLGISDDTVRRCVKDGVLPGVQTRDGGEIEIPWLGVFVYLMRQQGLMN